MKTNNEFIWTTENKKIAHDAILSDYNNYELQPVKFLKSIYYQKNGIARKYGKAHDYSFDANSIKTKKEIVGYALLDNITAEIIASKVRIDDVLKIAKNERENNFKNLPLLIKEIIKHDEKNIVGEQITKVCINGYDLIFNPLFDIWQVVMNGETFGEYKNLIDAYDEAING